MRYVSETVQHAVFESGAEDAHGNDAEAWAEPVGLGIYAFNPGGTSEPLVPGHDRVITNPTMYAPSEATVGPRDRITRASVLYEVDGYALAYSNPYDSSMNGLEIKLKVVTG